MAGSGAGSRRAWAGMCSPPPVSPLQISGADPFSKLVDVLRKKLGRDQVVRPPLLCCRACRPALLHCLRRQLLANPSLPLANSPPQFVYLKEAFCPPLDERVGALYEAFAVDGRLVVSYALTPAWG